MRLRASAGDERFADADGEGQIGEPIAVNVAQLAPADAELHAAETMRRDGNARPRAHFATDAIGDGAHTPAAERPPYFRPCGSRRSRAPSYS